MQSTEEKLGYSPEVRSVELEKEKVNAISSRILDWMRISGTTTEAEAVTSTCHTLEQEKKEYYSIRHMWSIYDLKKGSFDEAMNNIREKLPKLGWKITRDAPVKSQAKQPQIIAVNTRTNHTVDIEWHWKRSDPRDERIHVSVDSRCMKVPEGEEV